MNKRALMFASYATLGLFLAGPAYAHPGHGEAGLIHGFLHPVTGIDHLLAMVLVGMIAAQMRGRALYILPAAFMSMMVIGAAIGISGTSLPYFEVGITLSLIVFGLALAANVKAGTAIASALVGGFALFHGSAHGAEMPLSSDAVGYAAGFVAATALLHLLGILISCTGMRPLKFLPRLVGGASVVIGTMLAVGLG